MSEKRRGLGRGLGALIPSAPAAAKPGTDSPVDNVFFPGREGEGQPAPGAGAGAGAATAVVTRERPTSPVRDQISVVPTTKASSPATNRSTDGSATPGTDTVVDMEAPGDITSTGSLAREDGKVAATVDNGLVPVPGAEFAELPVEAVRPNPRQPRQVFDEEALSELMHSVREVGILQPVVVRRIGDEQGEALYELIMGERRLRAAKEAGLDRIPAIVRDTSDDDLLRDALLENLHRSQLNPLEEAAAYQQLLDDFGCTHEELAGRIGRSRPQISNTLRLLRLPPLVQRRVAAGVLSAGHARALLGLEDPGSMERLAQRIVAEGLSVRAVEEVVALGDGPVSRPQKRRPRAGAHTSELDGLASRLGDHLETRVSIALGKNRGRLTIDFASIDDLNRIIGTMSPEVRRAFDG